MELPKEYQETIINNISLVFKLMNSNKPKPPLKIIMNRFLQDKYIQYKFPKSKKKRIRKKWYKNKSYWKYVQILLHDKINNTIHLNEKCYNELKPFMEGLVNELDTSNNLMLSTYDR